MATFCRYWRKFDQLPLYFRRFLDSDICSRVWARIDYPAPCLPKIDNNKGDHCMKTLGV